MASISPVNAFNGLEDPLEAIGQTSPVYAGDLIEAVDDHTRGLLARRPGARRGRMIGRMLIGADLVGLTLAYFIATLGWGDKGSGGSPRELLVFVASLPIWVLMAKLHGLYRRDEERADHCTTDDIVGVFHLVTIGAWLLLVISRLLGRDNPGVINLAAFWLLAAFIVPIARTVTRRLCKRSRAYQQNTVIVGAGEIGQLI